MERISLRQPTPQLSTKKPWTTELIHTRPNLFPNLKLNVVSAINVPMALANWLPFDSVVLL